MSTDSQPVRPSTPAPGNESGGISGVGDSSGGRPIRRLLLLTHRLPYPPDRGDRIRSYHLIRTLAQHFDVALACTSDEPIEPEHRRRLGALVNPLAIERINPVWGRARALGALACGRAGTPSMFYRRRLARRIVQWHRSEPFDAVLTFCTGMIGYARQLLDASPDRPRHILDLVDVDSAKWAEYAADAAAPLRWIYAAEAKRLRRIEAGALDHFDAVTVVSRREYDLYRSTVGEHRGLHIVGNGVDSEYFTALPDAASQTLVFVGVLNYKPNADAVIWFVHHVMPELRRRLPQVDFQIVGRNPPKHVQALGHIPGAGLRLWVRSLMCGHI
jgi:sugar transferase (PEP-CTERM/EpsH1 system associated)